MRCGCPPTLPVTKLNIQLDRVELNPRSSDFVMSLELRIVLNATYGADILSSPAGFLVLTLWKFLLTPFTETACSSLRWVPTSDATGSVSLEERIKGVELFGQRDICNRGTGGGCFVVCYVP